MKLILRSSALRLAYQICVGNNNLASYHTHGSYYNAASVALLDRNVSDIPRVQLHKTSAIDRNGRDHLYGLSGTVRIDKWS